MNLFETHRICTLLLLAWPLSGLAQAGADRDNHGCIPSAGYVWSKVQKDCIRLFEKGICTEATDDSRHTAYIVFSPDSSYAELFFSTRKPTEILKRRRRTDGMYIWNVEDDDTKTVYCRNNIWVISQRGEIRFKQKK